MSRTFYALCLTIVAMTAAHEWSARARRRELDERAALAAARERQLGDVKRLVERTEAARVAFARKVALIEQLKSQRGGIRHR